MQFWLIGAGLPFLLLLLGLPMALGKVPPNPWYGFRSPRALSSPDAWYPVNRLGGFSLMAAGVIAALANGALAICFSDGPTEPVLTWMALQSAGWAMLSNIPPMVMRVPDKPTSRMRYPE